MLGFASGPCLERAEELRQSGCEWLQHRVSDTLPKNSRVQLYCARTLAALGHGVVELAAHTSNSDGKESWVWLRPTPSVAHCAISFRTFPHLPPTLMAALS